MKPFLPFDRMRATPNEVSFSIRGVLMIRVRNVSQRTKKFLLVVFAVCLLVPAGLLAQSGAGSIQGTVQDATSAGVPGASVHVVNQATGVAIDTTSNTSGFYSVPGFFA